MKGCDGPRVAGPPSGRVQVDAGQERGELGGGHLDAAGRGVGEAEGPAFEPLGPDGQAIAVPVQDLDAIAALVDEDEEVAGEGIELEGARRPGRRGRRSSCACRPVLWRGRRGRRRSVRTWSLLDDGDELAEGLGIEAGCDGDPASIGEDQFEGLSGGRGGGDGIGEDGDGEEVGGGASEERGSRGSASGWVRW